MQIGFPNVATMLSNNCVKQCDKILLPMLQNTTLGEIPNVAHTLPMLPKNTTKIGDTIVATHLKGASPLLHPNVACNIGKKHATMGTFVPCDGQGRDGRTKDVWADPCLPLGGEQR